MYHMQRWTFDKIKQRLELIGPKVYLQTTPLSAFRFKELEGPLAPPPVAPGVDDSRWTVIYPDDYWGRPGMDFVMRTSFTVPREWDSSAPVALYLPLSQIGDYSAPETLLYLDGSPYAACDRRHNEILLQPAWRDGASHTLALHGWTGMNGWGNCDPLKRMFMRQCFLVQIHQPTRDFIALARMVHETAENLDECNPARHALLNALADAFKILDTRDPDCPAFYNCVGAAAAALQAGIEKAGAPMNVTIHATGHAHLDIAWLWTLGQGRRKAERTFATSLRLMEQYPAYHFSQSQPQLYEFVRQDQPELFAAIQQRVAEGRWEPTGGMWVEADCNITGAESLARQFLLGRNYFRQFFGKDAETPVLWLPDVFGYAWALPQLIKQAGLKYFMTIKIGWSQYNRLPYDTFLWQGLDGTQILTHFSTVRENGSPYASTYNSMANAKESLGAWENFQQKDLQQDLLMAYGFGDGGGGPTREMLENIEVLGHMPALPQVKQSSVHEFFKTIAPLADDRKMPVWNGELYLEYHRGTYTTQARSKRLNRKSEFLLHDAEFLAAFASFVNPAYTYPAEEFTEAWRTVCLNQFHDIIPGSSIAPVYEESLAQYAQVSEKITHERDAALSALSASLGGDLLLANPTSFSCSDLAFIPGDQPTSVTLRGKPLALQPVEGGVLVDPGALPPYSLTPLAFSPAPVETAPAPLLWNRVLENDYLRVEFSPTGDITRIFDKTASREVLAPETLANQLQAFEDRPLTFDAWDIDIYYDDKMYLAEPASSLRLLENGPLRWTVEVKRKILDSQVIQRISLRHNSPRLDFDTWIDWKERHTLLKVAFPVDILSPVATYEIQWGNVQRPTHRNTSWDWARFETCAHKWVDLSEGGYGVSLLNDCKYGHDIHGSVMRLTLLRGPTAPDPLADYGEHRFVYSLLPHSGSWQGASQQEAYALNDPVICYRTAGSSRPASDARSLVACSAPHVIIETVKRAEDGDGLILRLYESQRKRGPVTLRFAFPVKAAWETSLLEENTAALNVEANSISMNIRPYQIMTIRVTGGSS